MALGSYTGPKSARAFLRYALAYAETVQAEKVYRVYISDCIRALVGAGERYIDLIDFEDYDPQEVVEHVLANV